MGVQARLWIEAPVGEEPRAREAAALAFARLAQLEQSMSDYRDSSEIAGLAKAAGGAPVPISADLARVLDNALRVARASGGAFDPTVGPLSQLWRSARRAGRLPSDDEVASARSLVTFQRLTLSPGPAASLSAPGMSLDLGGIAKGDAAAQARDVIAQAGFPSCMVALAGDVALGAPPQGRVGWRVGLAAERSGRKLRTLELAHISVSTSGDTEQTIELEGQRLSHLIDPRPGATSLTLARTGVVSVIHPDGATADALATAACVLLSDPDGPARVRALARAFPGARIEVLAEP
jgi:thiamine biosynthesis lipoprotein